MMTEPELLVAIFLGFVVGSLLAYGLSFSEESGVGLIFSMWLGIFFILARHLIMHIYLDDRPKPLPLV